MAAEGGGNAWIVLVIYIIPFFLFYKSAKKLIRGDTEKASVKKKLLAPGQAQARKYYRYIILVCATLFVVFLGFRIYAPQMLFAENLQSRFFSNIWVYVIGAGFPLALFGIAYGLLSLYRDRGTGWPILLVFCGFASLFVLSIFSVLLLLE